MVHNWSVMVTAVSVCLLKRGVVDDWSLVVYRGCMMHYWLLHKNLSVVHWGGMVGLMMDRGGVVALVVHWGGVVALVMNWSGMMNNWSLVMRFNVMNRSVMMDLSVVDDRCRVMHDRLVMRFMMDGLSVMYNCLVVNNWSLVVDHWGVVHWSGMVALMVHWGRVMALVVYRGIVVSLMMYRSAVMDFGMVDWGDSVMGLSVVHNGLLEENLSVVHVMLVVVMRRSTVHVSRLKRRLVSLEVGLLMDGSHGVVQNWSLNGGLVVHWFGVVALVMNWLRVVALVVHDSLMIHWLGVVALVMKYWFDSWFLKDSLVMSVMRGLVMRLMVYGLGVVHNGLMMHNRLGVVSLRMVNSLMMGSLVVDLLSHEPLEKWLGNFNILDSSLFSRLYFRFFFDNGGSNGPGLGGSWLLHIAHIRILNIVLLNVVGS